MNAPTLSMNTPIIYVIDDEPSVREGMQTLFEVAGYRVETFASGADFLAHTPSDFGCILLDIRMPDLNGLQVQEHLLQRGIRLPLIFITAFGDVPQTVRAIKAGAADVLTKPVDGAAVVSSVEALLAAHSETLDQARSTEEFRKNLDSLTHRERQILELVLQGMASRDIAKQLEISHRTVEVHRSHIVKKTGTTNLHHLFRIATTANIKIE